MSLIRCTVYVNYVVRLLAVAMGNSFHNKFYYFLIFHFNGSVDVTTNLLATQPRLRQLQ